MIQRFLRLHRHFLHIRQRHRRRRQLALRRRYYRHNIHLNQLGQNRHCRHLCLYKCRQRLLMFWHQSHHRRL
jgi:hypothetical protein